MTCSKTALLVLVCACGAATVAEFRIASADDPLEGATRLLLTLERDGVALSEAEHPVAFESLRLDDLPFGEGFRLRLDALAGPFLLARGRSFPFDVDASGPSRSPDIWLAPIGRFSEPLAGSLDAAPRMLAPTQDGALIATEAGTLYSWAQHDADGAPSLSRIANDPSLAGAAWAARDDALVAVTDDELVLLTPDRTASVLLPEHGSGAVVQARDARIVVAGGESRRAHVFRIETDALVLEREATLPCDVRDAPSALVPVTIPEDGIRLVTLCVDARTLVELDLDTGDATTLVLESLLDGAALTSVGPGLLLITGGRDGAPTAQTHVITVEDRLLVELSPPPEPLFRARFGHRAIALRPGLALVVGGRDDEGPVAPAELVAFPGSVVLTDSLRFDGSDVRASLLGDGSVLIASRAGGSLWVVPR